MWVGDKSVLCYKQCNCNLFAVVNKVVKNGKPVFSPKGEAKIFW